ncbi:MAG: hypothetical protein ACT4P4_13735 [Betaproteobacteria bacterium]
MDRGLRATSRMDDAALGAETLPLGLESIHSALGTPSGVIAQPVRIQGLVAIALRLFGTPASPPLRRPPGSPPR